MTKTIDERWRAGEHQEMIVGKTYRYIWPDGGEVQYKVTSIHEQVYEVLFWNGVENKISFASHINLGSVLID